MLRKYVFRPYSQCFSRLFKLEKKRVKNILGDGARIEHVGSTAVPRLRGKGILDIIVSVGKRDIKSTKRKLERNGYTFVLAGETGSACFSGRITDTQARSGAFMFISHSIVVRPGRAISLYGII